MGCRSPGWPSDTQRGMHRGHLVRKKIRKGSGGGKFKRNNFSECFLGNLRTWHAKVTLRWYPALHHTRTRGFVPVSNMLSKPWPCAKQSGAKRECLKEAVAARHTPIIPNPTLFFICGKVAHQECPAGTLHRSLCICLAS